MEIWGRPAPPRPLVGRRETLCSSTIGPWRATADAIGAPSRKVPFLVSQTPFRRGHTCRAIFHFLASAAPAATPCA
ncbi:hypothetical protein VTN96DRAFT_4465 [Rasamsonia emersonii]